MPIEGYIRLVANLSCKGKVHKGHRSGPRLVFECVLAFARATDVVAPIVPEKICSISSASSSSSSKSQGLIIETQDILIDVRNPFGQIINQPVNALSNDALQVELHLLLRIRNSEAPDGKDSPSLRGLYRGLASGPPMVLSR
jgi:hypothetical protein